MHLMCTQMFNACYTLHEKKNQELGRPSKKKNRCRADLSIEQFSIWLKHCHAVKFLFLAPEPILLNFSIFGSILGLIT